MTLTSDDRPLASPGIASVPPTISNLVLGLGLAVLGCLGGASVAVAGPRALVLPALLLIAAVVVTAPFRLAFPLLAIGVVLEPNAIDFTEPLADMVWDPPAGITLPLTITPFEIMLLVLAAAVAVRGTRSGHSLPPIAWAVPIVMVAGIAYGMRYGAPLNLAYHESRGLIFGLVAFFIAWRMPPPDRLQAIRWLMGASFALGAILLARYLVLIRPGDLNIPLEAAYAHEDAVFLAFGFALGCLVLIRAESLPPRVFAVVHNLVVLGALLGSSRRAATLALLVGLIAIGIMMLPRRPVQVIVVAIPLSLLAVMYLAAYWNHEYGATAQPARAVRSQISPNERDEGSDLYRATEVYNVEQTIRLNRLFGIGFGRPFAQFQPLPDLTDWWPLQSYTPHQSILWLWLKMGFAGIVVFLAAWLIAMHRSLAACLRAPPGEFPFVPLLVGAGLAMYLVYAKVDLALAPTRSAAALAVLFAIAYRLDPAPSEETR